MDIIRKFYHHLLKKIDKFLLRLCRGENLLLVVFLSGIARKIFLREFSIKKHNYRNIEELRQLVIIAMKEQAAELVGNYNKEYNISAGLKILLVLNLKTSFEDVWVKTAKNAGFNVDTFDADKISYFSPDVSNLGVMDQEAGKLLRKVKDFQPQLILLDVNYLGNPNTINNNFIQEIRKIHNCKIVGHMGDYCSKEAFSIAQYWLRSLDVVLHSAPGMSSGGLQNFYYIHRFVNEMSFYPSNERRTDIFFSGSGNISRYVYLAFAKLISKKRKYRCQINVHYHHDSLALSPEEYSRLIRGSRAVLNLSARPAPNVRIVTLRVQEAIASKSLLIEEKNDSITNIFTPYAHFIPFDSKKELAIAMDFSVNCGELVDKITEGAYRKYLREYSSKIIWNQILYLCKV
ncbi:MAG: glycosyltransferase [Candidatus Omnitrophica bacterium]|nr:glycosyltransferase [Candidatus Omnitrophota bacterium]